MRILSSFRFADLFCEMQIGSVFKKLFEDGMVKREDLFITSKLWFVVFCLLGTV